MPAKRICRRGPIPPPSDEALAAAMEQYVSAELPYTPSRFGTYDSMRKTKDCCKLRPCAHEGHAGPRSATNQVTNLLDQPAGIAMSPTRVIGRDESHGQTPHPRGLYLRQVGALASPVHRDAYSSLAEPTQNAGASASNIRRSRSNKYLDGLLALLAPGADDDSDEPTRKRPRALASQVPMVSECDHALS